MLHLTCWGPKGLRYLGHGRALTIMALPRQWEVGDGSVTVLVPSGDVIRMMRAALDARKNPLFAGREPLNRYQAVYEAGLQGVLDAGQLAPGKLMARTGLHRFPVADGDSLMCACQPGEECHRQWAARFLMRAGWRVSLDGQELTSCASNL